MLQFELTIRNPNNLTEMYVISARDDLSIWLEKGDGEGGEFKTAKLFEVIDKFYKDNF